LKKSWLVTVSAMAASGAAMAESAVTLYGLIDESILINTRRQFVSATMEHAVTGSG
jgi:predicted porin